MIQAKCTKKFRNKDNTIWAYRIIDFNGIERSIDANDLKKAISSGQINVVNLKLTTDNRLIDTKIDKLTDNEELNNSMYNKFKLTPEEGLNRFADNIMNLNNKILVKYYKQYKCKYNKKDILQALHSNKYDIFENVYDFIYNEHEEIKKYISTNKLDKTEKVILLRAIISMYFRPVLTQYNLKHIVTYTLDDLKSYLKKDLHKK